MIVTEGTPHVSQAIPAIVSGIVLLAFLATLSAVLLGLTPPAYAMAVNTLVSAQTAMVLAVVNYWLGSSYGSAQKNTLLYHSTPASTNQSTTAPTSPPTPASGQH